MLTFTYINTPEKLQQAVVVWEAEKELAIDLECENNLHHFGVYISLIQISTRDQNWVVDVLALPAIHPLLRVLENPAIQKVFHDVNFDFRILKLQFDCLPRNIFDTQLAALFLGKEGVGLGSLLEEYFSIKKETKFQRIDWTQRPLSLAMLTYAAKDTMYLLQLKEKLCAELRQVGRLAWMEEECTFLETLDYTYNEQQYLDVPHVKQMSLQQRAIFHALFEERQKLAQKVDKPVFKVISNKQLLAFAQHPPRDVEAWKKLRGVHPVVRANAPHLFRRVNEAKKQPEELPARQKTKKMSSWQTKLKNDLLELRNTLAQQFNIKGYLLLKQDELRDVVLFRSLDHLRKWQQTVFRNQPLVQRICQAK